MGQRQHSYRPHLHNGSQGILRRSSAGPTSGPVRSIPTSAGIRRPTAAAGRLLPSAAPTGLRPASIRIPAAHGHAATARLRPAAASQEVGHGRRCRLLRVPGWCLPVLLRRGGPLRLPLLDDRHTGHTMTWTFTGLNSSTLYSRPDEPPSLTCIMYGVAQILVRPAHRFIVSLQVDTHQMFLTLGTCPSHIGRHCAVETSFSMDSFAKNEALDLLAARLSYRHDDEL